MILLGLLKKKSIVSCVGNRKGTKDMEITGKENWIYPARLVPREDGLSLMYITCLRIGDDY